jgi:hypothetical protein
VIDAGAVAPLLRTFAAGIPELSPQLTDADSERAPPAAVSDEQRHLHGWALPPRSTTRQSCSDLSHMGLPRMLGLDLAIG